MNTPHPQRADAAAWWLAQSSLFLQRYIARPEGLDCLMEILRQYREAVEAGQVEPPRIFGV